MTIEERARQVFDEAIKDAGEFAQQLVRDAVANGNESAVDSPDATRDMVTHLLLARVIALLELIELGQ